MHRIRDWTYAIARNVAMRMAPKVLSIGGTESTGESGLAGMAESMAKRPRRCGDRRWVFIDRPCQSAGLTVATDHPIERLGVQEV